MAEKDNANPIIYSQSSTANQRISSAAHAEWWRDTAIHSSATSSSSKANGSFSFSTTEPLLDDHDRDHDDEHPVSSTVAAASVDDEKIDSQEVYDLIRSITDPEHPLTLEQLAVVNASHITIDHGTPGTNKLPHILLEFTPTIPHCSMATLIGLSLRVRLLRSLPPRFKVDIRVRAGTHQSENAVNKQLNDKERVAAALENAHLLEVVQGCLSSAVRRGKTEEELRRELEEGAELGLDGQNVWKTVEEVATRMGLEV